MRNEKTAHTFFIRSVINEKSFRKNQENVHEQERSKRDVYGKSDGWRTAYAGCRRPITVPYYLHYNLFHIQQ